MSNLEKVIGSNDTIYHLGTFSDPAGDWIVIHAICQAGNADAAVTASVAHKDFGVFNVQVFIGVAGSLKEDLPIGSVVIGNYVYNAHSAKVDDNGYYSRPRSHPAAPELLQAAQLLILDESWVDLIKSPISMTLPTVDKYPCPYPPVGEIKAIASGEQVIAGGKTKIYQEIRKFLSDAACVEMEGWGAMNAAHSERTPAIVIRGISDMCAGKEHVADKQYQPIASAHAAAFAFSILSVRSRASPSDADGVGLVEQGDHEDSAISIDPRVEFIINFKGALSDWPKNKIDTIINGLRISTGDSELTLVRVDEGSIRIVLSIREKDVSALTLENVRSASGSMGAQLLGAVTAKELTSAEESKAALKRASADLLSWEQTLPGGGWLERPEKLSIESRFTSQFSTTVVLGEPGSGKSALLAAIATELVKANTSILAIKADFLSNGIKNEQDLQENLSLPSLPSDLIEKLSLLQPVVLIIDQLDALASQLDLRSDRLNVLLNLVRKVGGQPNVHIILSSRSFEFNHDVRLRAIEAEAVNLELPAWHEVKEKLSLVKVDADSWPENARQMIRNPQALKIYLTLTKTSEDPPYSKYQSMLEQLWRQKIASAPDSDALASLATEIAGIMAEEETLWLAASRFDTQAYALERLESIDLIVRSDKSIAFSHQTVFDYILARSFVSNAGRLSTYVLERQDSLFVRPKLWSALRYLRDAEIFSYEREFMEIWRHDDLRKHLRLLLIEFMGELHEPISFEIVCLEAVMQSAELRVAGLKSIIGSQGWFSIFARSAISAAMNGAEIESRLSMTILQRAWAFDADEVIFLLRENWLQFPKKDSFIWMVLDACAKWIDDIVEIAQIILSRTEISTWQVDYTASMLVLEQPKVAFRLIHEKLKFLLKEARTLTFESPILNEGDHEVDITWEIIDKKKKPFKAILQSHEWSSLTAMSEANPQIFLEELWPWFRSVFSELSTLTNDETNDIAFPGHHCVDLNLGEVSDGLGREWPILDSLVLALEGVVNCNSSFFLCWAKENSDLNLIAPQRLIAHGFCRDPEKYANEVFNWVFQDTRRLQLGDSYGSRKTTIALISAVSPYWTNQQINQFESNVQNYKPLKPVHLSEANQRKDFAQFIRTSKAHLLSAISFDRLSEESKKQVTSEKRAFGNDLDQGMRFTGSSLIGSPMEANEMMKAKDRDILKMLDEIPDNTDWDHPTSWMRGGNIQLSRAFAEFAKTDQLRALRIMEQFKPEAQSRAAGYALNSMADAGGQDQSLQEAVIDLDHRGFNGTEFKSSVAYALEKIAHRGVVIDESVIQILVKWLNNSILEKEPSDVYATSFSKDKGIEKPSSDAHFHSIIWGQGGISLLPSGNFPILSALTSILLNGTNQGRDRLLDILNNHLNKEENPVVWQSLLIRLSNAGGSNPEIVSKFLRKLFNLHPLLLETHEAILLFAYAHRWDDSLVHELITTWDLSNNPMLRQAHGELVGLISIVNGAEIWTKNREKLIESGSTEAKIGLAYSGVNLWNESKLHAAAGRLLTRLIPEANKDLMSAIMDVFRQCNDLEPDPITIEFLQTLSSPKVNFQSAPSTFVIEKLQSLLPHFANGIGIIAMKLLKIWRSELGDIRTSTALAAPQLTDLAITLHRLGGDSRQVGVTIFEELIELDAYGSRETLSEIDGRFGSNQTRTRQRIVRRTAKRSKRRST